jgi:AbrB family looped-hinge helix DNA binding protein
MHSTITSKGQATIPKAIRDHLGVSPGQEIKFFTHPDGSVFILPVKPLQSLRGIVKYKGPAITLKQMDEAIAEAASERHIDAKRR